jgi:hypothetical protein
MDDPKAPVVDDGEVGVRAIEKGGQVECVRVVIWSLDRWVILKLPAATLRVSRSSLG